MTTVPKNLESLTYRQLQALEANIEAAKARKYDEVVARHASAEQELLAKLTKMLAGSGKTAADVVHANGNGHRKPRKLKVPVRYRDPKTGNTWSGRGRMAGWLADAVQKGADREHFRV